MYTGGLCSLRRQDGFWAGSRLYSADYVRDAATEARHEGLPANRPAVRGGMQGAESEFWKGWPSEVPIDRTADTETIEHVEEPRSIRSDRNGRDIPDKAPVGCNRGFRLSALRRPDR